MINREAVADWLNMYVAAWNSYDPEEIGELFSEDADYYYGPYANPVRGREAIVANWLENRDTPGTYKAQYEPVAVDGNLAVANGRSTYFEEDGTTFRTEYDNIFLIRFDEEGRCTEFREWYMEKPRSQT